MNQTPNETLWEKADKPPPVVLTVSALARQIRNALEDAFAEVRVSGELTRVFKSGRGHHYGTLRDLNDDSGIDLVLWKGQGAKFASLMAEGAQVEVTGRVSAYAPSSRYQLVVSHVALVGAGALLAELERLKAQLRKEGLFDRQRPLPKFPHTLGVITSPDGAVIEDILHRLRERFPLRVLLWPVLVQGAGAAEQVAQAVRGFSALKASKDTTFPVPDLLVVARGGGSLEDLWAFNEEVVVRAIAASAIPVVSAIGHETDTTLADFAADLRAPTPTAAAELLTPERAVLLGQLDGQKKGLLRALGRSLRRAEEQLCHNKSRLSQGERVLEHPRRALDEREVRLGRAVRRGLGDSAKLLEARRQRLELRAPARRLAEWQKNLHNAQLRLSSAMKDKFMRAQAELQSCVRLLENLDYHQVLARGFALAQDGQGRVLRLGKDFQTGRQFSLTLSDTAQVLAETKEVRAAKTKK